MLLPEEAEALVPGQSLPFINSPSLSMAHSNNSSVARVHIKCHSNSACSVRFESLSKRPKKSGKSEIRTNPHL